MYKKYFRLLPYVKYLSDSKGGCLYNTLTGDMIKVNQQLTNVLNKSMNNQNLNYDEVSIVNDLINEHLGQIYDQPVFTESPRSGAGPQFKDYLFKKSKLNDLFIQVSNVCNLNCRYCDNTNKIYRCTSCKKWNNELCYAFEIKMKDVILTAYNLGCRNLHLFGGNPFLEKERLVNFLNISKECGFKKNYIYTNLTSLNDENFEMLKEFRVILVIDIPTIDEDAYIKITEESLCFPLIMEKFKKLNEYQIAYLINTTVSIFNEEIFEDDLKKMQKLFNGRVNVNYIYPVNDNRFYSKDYQTDMYKKKFGDISNESISMLQDYNSCLYGKISVNLSGEFTPCPMMNSYGLGNVGECSLLEIVKSSKYRYLTHLNKSKIEKCRNCAYRLNCFECRAIEYEATKFLEGVEFCNELQ